MHASPRPDVLRGWQWWRWFLNERKRGNYLDRTLQLRCEGHLGNRLATGTRLAIDRGTIIWLGNNDGHLGSIEIEENVYIGPWSYLGSLHHLKIGKGTLIGAGAYIITANHRYARVGKSLASQGYFGGNVSIGRNVWIGAHVVILPSLEIGDGAVIAAGAVVRETVPEGELWGGVPAKCIKKLEGGHVET